MLSALRAATDAKRDKPTIGALPPEPRTQVTVPAEGAPSTAWFEGVLAVERQALAQLLARRHEMLLADLQAKLAEKVPATEVQVFQAKNQNAVSGEPLVLESMDMESKISADSSSAGTREVFPVTVQSGPMRPPEKVTPSDPMASNKIGEDPILPNVLQTAAEKEGCEEAPRTTSTPTASAASKKSALEKSEWAKPCLPGALQTEDDASPRCQKSSSCEMASDSTSPRANGESRRLTELKQEMLLAGRSRETNNFFSKLVRDQRFELAVTSIIMCNAVVISFDIQYRGFDVGKELDYRGYSVSSEETWPGGKFGLDVMDYVFGVVFTLELIAKVLGQKIDWLFDPWNYLDAAIVSLWLIEKPFGEFLHHLPADATLLRTARLFRVLRLVKVLRTLQGFDALYLLLTTLKGCFWVLGWSCVLLFVTQMLLAMLFWFILQEHYFTGDYPLQERQEVFQYFGTWTRAMLTMFEMTLANWPPVCRLLVENVNEWFSLFCLAHKLTMGFAVIGVINGVFMQETFKVAATDDKIMVRQREREVKVHTSKMNRLFKAADESGDGLIDLEEFKQIMQDKEILFWLSSMEITVRDPLVLFMMLDANGDGQLTCEELVRGALALRGGAKSVDVLEMRAQIGMIKKALKMEDFKVQQPLYQGGSSAHEQEGDAIAETFVNPFKVNRTEGALKKLARSVAIANQFPPTRATT